tara:strand:+ start:476 stop:775 length:300 start_codon:yes stop_codon:yes gene_type:complete
MIKTDMSNVDERFKEVEIYLASLGSTPAEQDFPKLRTRGWFFWSMTFLTCLGWWAVFRNWHTSSNNYDVIEWTDRFYRSMENIKHEDKVLEAFVGGVSE